MAQTKAGANKAKKTIEEKHGKDFWAKIGAKGGKLGRTGGFHANRASAVTSGSLGGKRSKRGYKFLRESKDGTKWVYQHKATGEVHEFDSF